MGKAKEQFFKKEGAAKSELKTKKAEFQKKCAKQKESITKNSLAEQAYQESKTKKMCMKTRVASELNNKRMIQYYDFGIKKLKADCSKADAMYTADRQKFVDGVCLTIRQDITGAVSSWMSTNYKINIGVQKKTATKKVTKKVTKKSTKKKAKKEV